MRRSRGAAAPFFMAMSLAVLYAAALTPDRGGAAVSVAVADQANPSETLRRQQIARALDPDRIAALIADPKPAVFGPIGVLAPYAPPTHSLHALRDVPVRLGRAIDERYRQAFEVCDRTDRFNRRAPRRRPTCRQEPNRLRAFLRLPIDQSGDSAVYLDTNMTLDLSGGRIACTTRPGDVRRCETFYDYAGAPSEAYDVVDKAWRTLFVASDVVPYVSIPAAALGGAPERAFQDKSGVSIGDVGVVIYNDRVAPVLVADAAPPHRALEGSLALFDALGVTRCRRRAEDAPQDCADAKRYGLGANVVAILFPNSRLDDLTASTVSERVRARAVERLQALRRAGRTPDGAQVADLSLKAPAPARRPKTEGPVSAPRPRFGRGPDAAPAVRRRPARP